MADDVTTRRRTFVLEDTKNRDYRHIRAGLLRRGWQQVAFPRRQASEEGDYHKQGSSKFDLCWVQRRGAMGVASVGLKVAPCPDLIWTLSHGRLPASGGLGPGQITNFFDRTSCLTTKVIYAGSLIAHLIQSCCTSSRRVGCVGRGCEVRRLSGKLKPESEP